MCMCLCIHICVSVWVITREHWLQCEDSIVCCLSCHVSDLINWILTSPRLNPPDVFSWTPSLGFHGNTIIPHANWALIRAAIMVWREKEVVHVCVSWGGGWGVEEGCCEGLCFTTDHREVHINLPCWIPNLSVFFCPFFFSLSVLYQFLSPPSHSAFWLPPYFNW